MTCDLRAALRTVVPHLQVGSGCVVAGGVEYKGEVLVTKGAAAGR